LRFHFLLRSRLQSAFVLCLAAHALNRIHQIALLRQKGVAQIRGPLNVVSQQFHEVRCSSQSLDAGVPGFFCRCVRELLILQVLILLQPPLQKDDFDRIRGGRQNLRQ
jgi:hypothetical protein